MHILYNVYNICICAGIIIDVCAWKPQHYCIVYSEWEDKHWFLIGYGSTLIIACEGL